MTVFFYDRTFDGLLTAIFDAYSRKSFPVSLLKMGEATPLFAEERHTVVTDADAAERVWTALKRKLSREICNMLQLVWMSETEKSDVLLFRYICKTFDNASSIALNFGDPDVLEAKNLARKVAHEALYLKQFVRFQKAADDIFFAPVRPLYNALPLTIHHFSDRFSDQQWVIYDLKRKYGYYYDLHHTQEITLNSNDLLLNGKLDESLMASDEKLFQGLWKNYCKSLTIKERLNLRLQRQHMPVRFWQDLTEKQ
ncbi:MAG: TIGR03915 family putative DNA repair protein [Bacteroidales bacterium]|jgi:probable DNA metabolism protein|nr:TIGR03915 family putative DNA repair protein [Bacteroidales bacterium]